MFELLQPYTDFFASRSVRIESPDSIDCQAVIREITQADRETPADLLDAICLIDELANAVTVELLLDRVPASSLGLEPGGEHSEADIVTAALLSHREKLVQTHALSRLKRARSYDYFQANQTTAPKFVTPAEETLEQLERDIDSWHVERFRAQGTKVEIFENGNEVEFSIMHGSLYRRQPVLNNGRFGFQSFWPVQSASAIYNREFGELRINAKSAKEKALYCRLLECTCLGTKICFRQAPSTRLNRSESSNSTRWHLAISKVCEMYAWLSSGSAIQTLVNGVITIRKGDDLFDWAQAKKKDIHIERRLISANLQDGATKSKD